MLGCAATQNFDIPKRKAQHQYFSCKFKNWFKKEHYYIVLTGDQV